MDGRKNKLTDSLQFRLSTGTAIAIIGVALIAGVLSYWWAFEEAIELQDEQLIQLGFLVNSQRITPPDANQPIQISTRDPESHFVVQWLDQDQTTAELPSLPQDLSDGLHTRQVNNTSWRLLVKTLSNNSRVVVAQQTEMRDEIARATAINTLIPLIILIPLLLMWISYLIRQIFSPLKKMASSLDNSNDQDLKTLPQENLATEIMPFVMAINRLLERVHQSIVLQRQFVRDAAHELRSPLTAISLQTERLVELSAESPLHYRLENLYKATERTRILIEQLLTMARAQEENIESDSQVSLKSLLREVLEDLLPLAEVKTIDVCVTGDDIEVRSQMMSLHILLKNLIENAIRYTPNGGEIEIILNDKANATELIIRDTGPGIPSAEFVRVFDPFYRVPGNDQPGSGLGLSIVKTIADRLGVSVELYNSNQHEASGLCVQIRFKP